MKSQIYFGIGVSILIFLYQQRIPLWLKVIWGYFLLQTWLPSYSDVYQPEWGKNISNVLSWNASKNTISLLLLPIIVMGFKYHAKVVIIWCLRIFFIIDSIYLISGGRGIMLANTFDAAVMAALSPLFFYKSFWNYVVIACAMFATIWVKSRSAYIAWGVIGLVYWIPFLQIFKPRIKYLLITLTGTAVTAGLFFGVRAWLHNPRAILTANYMGWWWDNVNIWWGAGLGSFEWLGLFLKSGIDYTPYLMHNDWAQMLFEGGVIGLLMSIFLFAWGAVKLNSNKNYQAIWLAVGAASTTYYLLHSWVVQVIMLMILVKIIDNETKK